MTPDEKELRRLLKAELDQSHPSPLGERARRRIVTGRAIFVAATSLAMAATAYAGFAITQVAADLTGSPDQRSVSGAQGEEKVEPREPRPITPKVEVATGHQQGSAWSVFSYRAMASVPGSGGAEEEEALCLSMGFGSSRRAEATCTVGLQEPFVGNDAVYAVPSSAPGWNRAFFGIVDKKVEHVELRLDDGTSYAAEIHNGGPELRAPFNFFVGFVPEWRDVTIVAVDRSGATAETDHLPAPPRLTVTKTGDGAGTVTGTRTEELGCSGCEPHRWIDCGEECLALINDASVTLEAHPDQGSVFVRWDGACSGVLPCVLQVDSDKTVDAVFQKVP